MSEIEIAGASSRASTQPGQRGGRNEQPSISTTWRSSPTRLWVSLLLWAITLVGIVGVCVVASHDWGSETESSLMLGVSVGALVLALAFVITTLKARWILAIAGIVGVRFGAPVLWLWGSCRLARPGSPWARAFYGKRQAADAWHRYNSRTAREQPPDVADHLRRYVES